MTTQPQIDALHAAYVRATGLDIPLNMGRIYMWEVWCSKGFTQADLLTVVRHIRQGIRDKKRNLGALRFDNLIRDTDRYEEDLAEARAADNLRSKSMRRAQTPSRGEAAQTAGAHTEKPAAKVLSREELAKYIADMRKAAQ